MKKYAWVILLIFIVLPGMACEVGGPNSGVPPHPPGEVNSPPVIITVLPEDSPHLGTFEAKRENQLQYWDESDQFTQEGGRVGTRYLLSLTLAAKAGCSWNYKPEGSGSREGYYLECEGDDLK